jgi:hypothetical protein
MIPVIPGCMLAREPPRRQLLSISSGQSGKSYESICVLTQYVAMTPAQYGKSSEKVKR